MEFGAFKPLITALVLPLMSLTLLVFAGLWLAARRQRKGLVIAGLALALLWLISCHGTAVWLARTVLPQFAPLTLAQLKSQQVQAIVVLGGGMFPEAPEYGQPQPSPATAARLRYGVWLSKQSGLPIAFTGGNGWSAKNDTQTSEAAVTARVALEDYNVTLRWLETQSRDTAENARFLAPLLKRDGVQRVALVTDAWHMPRAAAAFERTGLRVSPAPMGFLLATHQVHMEWMPTVSGLSTSTRVLQEFLGITMANLMARFSAA